MEQVTTQGSYFCKNYLCVEIVKQTEVESKKAGEEKGSLLSPELHRTDCIHHTLCV